MKNLKSILLLVPWIMTETPGTGCLCFVLPSVPSGPRLLLPTAGCGGCRHRAFSSTTWLFAKRKKSKKGIGSAASQQQQPKGPGRIVRPANEFSRVYYVSDTVLKKSGHHNRDYLVEIVANEEERLALAKRFDLACIDRLNATLALRRESSYAPSSSDMGVEVDGTVSARVGQVCVRTAESFDVNLEFPLFAIARPVPSLSSASASSSSNSGGGGGWDDLDYFGKDNVYDYEEEEETHVANKQQDKKNKRNKNSIRAPDRNIDEMDILALQRLLQDVDVEDSVVEDEGVYTTDGKLDIGELVAQLFWLKLDPLPKKPGTDPIRMSITG